MTTRALEEQENTDYPPSLEERIRAMRNRTPEQISAARARVFAGSPEPCPLPLGKTLEDVIVGALPDDKSEEEILAAIVAERLEWEACDRAEEEYAERIIA